MSAKKTDPPTVTDYWMKCLLVACDVYSQMRKESLVAFHIPCLEDELLSKKGCQNAVIMRFTIWWWMNQACGITANHLAIFIGKDRGAISRGVQQHELDIQTVSWLPEFRDRLLAKIRKDPFPAYSEFCSIEARVENLTLQREKAMNLIEAIQPNHIEI